MIGYIDDGEPWTKGTRSIRMHPKIKTTRDDIFENTYEQAYVRWWDRQHFGNFKLAAQGSLTPNSLTGSMIQRLLSNDVYGTKAAV